MTGTIEQIFICPAGGAEMQQVPEVTAIRERGLEGDRYSSGGGTWPEADVCQVTLIRAEDLEQIAASTGLSVLAGEHRRNIVVRGLQFEAPEGLRLQIGEVILEYDRPRPPCRYLESKSAPGMMAALGRHSGHCFKVRRGGVIRTGGPIVVAPA